MFSSSGLTKKGAEMWWSLIIGLMIGGLLGILTMSIILVGGNNDKNK